ncbi:hypothetical protein EDB80DRAFT_864230 [Ilyonectria destructans]|nr:hypothetical protein EDB80DRAFT_864230 [Ilyonectria destructans]
MVGRIWRDYFDDPLPDHDDDLSKGNVGLYRYLYFVSSVYLRRPSEEQNNPPAGWAGKTDDINKGRGGDFLYLI